MKSFVSYVFALAACRKQHRLNVADAQLTNEELIVSSEISKKIGTSHPVKIIDYINSLAEKTELHNSLLRKIPVLATLDQ